VFDITRAGSLLKCKICISSLDYRRIYILTGRISRVLVDSTQMRRKNNANANAMDSSFMVIDICWCEEMRLRRENGGMESMMG
jgi:hypothetical protein